MQLVQLVFQALIFGVREGARVGPADAALRIEKDRVRPVRIGDGEAFFPERLVVIGDYGMVVERRRHSLFDSGRSHTPEQLGNVFQHDDDEALDGRSEVFRETFGPRAGIAARGDDRN